MSYYHIKNINIDKKKNNISADLADSSLYPLTFYNSEFLCQRNTFEETYAEFIYNLVSGNFHPTSNSKYSKLVLNNYLDNYFFHYLKKKRMLGLQCKFHHYRVCLVHQVNLIV